MHRFKFRAWHSVQKRMIDVYGLGTDFVTENTLDGVDPGTNCWHGDDMEDLLVLQYVGLDDIEGNELAEGDIIMYHNNSISTKESYWFPIYVIEHNGFGWELKHVGGGHPSDTPDWNFEHYSKSFERMGNIYENPELLKEVENGGS